MPEENFNVLMPQICNFFSKTNFWIENLLFIICFAAFELALSPLVFLKTFYTIMFSYKGLTMKLLNILRWATLGFLYIIYILGKDIVVLIHILRMYEGCKAFKDKYPLSNDDELSVLKKVELFNEVRTVVI